MSWTLLLISMHCKKTDPEISDIIVKQEYAWKSNLLI